MLEYLFLTKKEVRYSNEKAKAFVNRKEPSSYKERS